MQSARKTMAKFCFLIVPAMNDGAGGTKPEFKPCCIP